MYWRDRVRGFREKMNSDHSTFVVGIVLALLITSLFKLIVPEYSVNMYEILNDDQSSVLYEISKVWIILAMFFLYMLMLYITRVITNKIAYRKIYRSCETGEEIDRRYDVKKRKKLFAFDISASLVFLLATLISINMIEMMIFVYIPFYLMMLTIGCSILLIRFDIMRKLITNGVSRVSSMVVFTVNWSLLLYFAYVLTGIIYEDTWFTLIALLGTLYLVTSIVLVVFTKERRRRSDRIG